MTTSQIAAIPSPADGLQVYNTEWSKLYVYVVASGNWKEMSYGTGTILPANLNFTCGDLLNDLRDGGKVYETVLIGTQCWMKQNLNVGTRINGSLDQQNNSTIEKYCYNDDELNCDVYGGLYQWNEMMNYAPSSNTNPSGVQGICPTGWHVPSDAEFCQMAIYIDPTVDCNASGWTGTDIGIKMKSQTGWYANGNGSNLSGFTALPGGYIADGVFENLTLSSFVLTSTEYLTTFARQYYLEYAYSQVRLGADDKIRGFSSRCVKN
jgi:uncharacterized protein (TIGR02145 family)